MVKPSKAPLCRLWGGGETKPPTCCTCRLNLWIKCRTKGKIAWAHYPPETVLYNMKRFKLGWGGVGMNIKLKWICSLHHKSTSLRNSCVRFFSSIGKCNKDYNKHIPVWMGLWFSNVLYTRMHSNCQEITRCTSPLWASEIGTSFMLLLKRTSSIMNIFCLLDFYKS